MLRRLGPTIIERYRVIRSSRADKTEMYMDGKRCGAWGVEHSER